ncbi:MAG: hypothetical protein K2J90_07015 [Lachnospiraceae bacterium]|nr:hypothetical protein [Lachnospiraceae bacterium]
MMMMQEQFPPPKPQPSFPPKKLLPQPLSFPQQLKRRMRMMIHVQQLPPPKPHPPVADKSPIRKSSNYLYTDIICEGKKGVTDLLLLFFG